MSDDALDGFHACVQGDGRGLAGMEADAERLAAHVARRRATCDAVQPAAPADTLVVLNRLTAVSDHMRTHAARLEAAATTECAEVAGVSRDLVRHVEALAQRHRAAQGLEPADPAYAQVCLTSQILRGVDAGIMAAEAVLGNGACTCKLGPPGCSAGEHELRRFVSLARSAEAGAKRARGLMPPPG
jgi:hypothetical protein